MSSDWMYYIFDIFKGLQVFTINFQASAYLVIVIILIVVISSLSIIMLFTMFGVCNCDWMDSCDEILFIILYELLFFGFLALPIIKFLLQTYDCKTNSSGDRVLKRSDNIKCESAGQIILFIFAIITIILLLVGATIRNLAREEYMHFKTYKWRVKPTVKHLIVKEMYLKIAIMIFAVFGPDHEWWPSLINLLLSFGGGLYYFISCPYVRNQFNNIKVAYYSMMTYIFFVSMIVNINSSSSKAASVLFFFFFIPGIIGYVASYLRNLNVVFLDHMVMEPNELADREDLESSKMKNEIIFMILNLKLAGIKVFGVKLESKPNFGSIVHGKFSINGEKGLINLCIFIAKLANQTFGKKIYFSRLLLSGFRETMDSQKVFIKDSAKLLQRLFTSGCLKFLTHFQLRHFLFDHKNLLDVFEYFSNNPIIEEIDIPENELTVKIIKAIINKIKDCPRLKTIAVDCNALYANDIQ